MKRRDAGGLTRRQTAGLARALRLASAWATGLPGESTATLVNDSGLEVTIEVRRPVESRTFVVRGFRPERE